jgi:hypothetical protein
MKYLDTPSPCYHKRKTKITTISLRTTSFFISDMTRKDRGETGFTILLSGKTDKFLYDQSIVLLKFNCAENLFN